MKRYAAYPIEIPRIDENMVAVDGFHMIVKESILNIFIFIYGRLLILERDRTSDLRFI